MSDAISQRPVFVTIATLSVLVLLVGGLHGDGVLSDRAAWGALAGLSVGTIVLAVWAIVVYHYHGGPAGE